MLLNGNDILKRHWEAEDDKILDSKYDGRETQTSIDRNTEAATQLQTRTTIPRNQSLEEPNRHDTSSTLARLRSNGNISRV